MKKEDRFVARQFLNMVSAKPNTTSITQNKMHNSGMYDLTVIIPCYNEEKYINDCIDSVLCQINKYRIKIVVINDGSTDNTSKILGNYEHFQNIVVIHQENCGFSGARNRGLKEADGQYIFFLDADDYLIDGTIENMLDIALKYKADIVEAQMLDLIDGSVIRSNKANGTEWEIKPDSLSGYVWGKMIRSSLFCDVSFPEKYWYEDSIMAYLIYPRCHKAVKYDEEVYVYRRNNEGITCKSQNSPKSVDTYWITEQMLEDMDKLEIKINQDIYELLLKQIALNYVRTVNQELNIKIAIFILTVEWFEKIHVQFSTSFRFASILEKALEMQDFKLYEKGCMILWNR